MSIAPPCQDGPPHPVRWFAVIGAQRTGTNLLREILNTNSHIAMLGEVMLPHRAPAHWDNFCRNLPFEITHPATSEEADALLDDYFRFVGYRIRNFWKGNAKRNSHIFGVDIKYNQLDRVAPQNWRDDSPFLLSYFRKRGVILIHTIRNPVHCAISTIIAAKRNLWHNYDGAMIYRSYEIDPEECLAYARSVVRQRQTFLADARGCKIVLCPYESLLLELDRAADNGGISEGQGVLREIASVLGVSSTFRYEGRLKKAINVPYSKLLSNYESVVKRLRYSEFSELCALD
jgi:LPS sulfotransferase NodH